MSTYAQRSANAEAVARYKQRHPDRIKIKHENYRREHKARLNGESRKYWVDNPEKRREHYARRRERIKADPIARARRNEIARLGAFRLRKLALSRYGEICQCCGEHRNEFLAIDHLNGCSKELRKIQGGGTSLYRWLKRNGFPDGYQVLCHNCNMAKGLYGLCPHKKETSRCQPTHNASN